MDLKLNGRVAFIGGSSKGLGKGCALQLAKEGVDVVICSRTKDELLETSEFIEENTNSNVLAVTADLSKKKDIEFAFDKTIDEFGKIDILVNNSGGPSPGGFFDFNETQWYNSFELILLYVIRTINLAVPYMKEQKWGRIINLTSITVKEPAENLILSNVFRTGVISLSKTISKDLIKDNITINNVCPGAFKTDRAIELMLNESKLTGKSIDEIEQERVIDLPMNRFQSIEEMGNLVTFLCSELAESITGTTIQIDGGISKCLF